MDTGRFRSQPHLYGQKALQKSFEKVSRHRKLQPRKRPKRPKGKGRRRGAKGLCPGQGDGRSTQSHRCDLKGGLKLLRKEAVFPAVLGYDLAGVVEKVGEEVTGFSVGDEIVQRSRVCRVGFGLQLASASQKAAWAKMCI